MVDTKEYFYKYYNPFTHQLPITQISYYILPFLSFFKQMLYLKTSLHSMSGQETSNHDSLKQSNPFLSNLRDEPSVMPLLIQDQWNLSRVFHIFRLLQKLSLRKLVEVIYQDTWMCVSRRTGEFRSVLLTLIHNQFFPSDDVETSNTFFNCVNYWQHPQIYSLLDTSTGQPWRPMVLMYWPWTQSLQKWCSPLLAWLGSKQLFCLHRVHFL